MGGLFFLGINSWHGNATAARSVAFSQQWLTSLLSIQRCGASTRILSPLQNVVRTAKEVEDPWIVSFWDHVDSKNNNICSAPAWSSVTSPVRLASRYSYR